MKKLLLFFFLTPFLFGCFKGEKADLIIHNAQIFKLDEGYSAKDAIAINNGNIIQVGPEREILNGFRSENSINGAKKPIYPAFIDANSTLFYQARQLSFFKASEMETIYEFLLQLEKFKQKNTSECLIAYDYSLTNWTTKEQGLLDERFPDTAVLIFNRKENLFITNQFFLTKYQYTPLLTPQKLDSSEVIDSLITAFSEEKLKTNIQTIQKQLIELGYTELILNNINLSELELLKELDQNNQIQLNLSLLLHTECLPSYTHFSFSKKINPIGFYLTQNDTLPEKLSLIIEEARKNNLILRFHDQLISKPTVKNLLEQTLSATNDYRWQVLFDSMNTRKANQIASYNLLPIITPSTIFIEKIKLPIYLIGSHSSFSTNSPFDCSQHISKKAKSSFQPTDILYGYTKWGAYGLKKEAQIGTLESGKQARMIQLAQPFEIHTKSRPNYVTQSF